MGNPFRLTVKVRGPNSNITRCWLRCQSNFADFGAYFTLINLSLVSTFIEEEVLPFFLLQQPEVHLHPRAQAELSSLLAKH